MKYRVILAVLSVVLLMGACSTPEPSQADGVNQLDPSERLNEGELAVNFEFTDYQGSTVQLIDLKGQKVYLKYWASWCSICTRGLPELDELFAKDRDYVVYSVVTPNVNGEKSIEDFKAWFDTEAYPHVVVLFDENASFSRKLGALAVPTSVYIGSDGVLIRSLAGHSKNDDIETFINTFK
jgi:thiol-disulfide isomerase/thioredoxin